MKTNERKKKRREETAVDDVRRVRERLSRQSDGDVRALVRQGQKIADMYRGKLGLKVESPSKGGRRNGTSG